MVTNPVKEGEVQFYTAEVNSILEKIPIHETLNKIYQVIGNPNIEYYFGPWTLFSLNKVQEHYNILLEKNQNRAISTIVSEEYNIKTEISIELTEIIVAIYKEKLNLEHNKTVYRAYKSIVVGANWAAQAIATALKCKQAKNENEIKNENFNLENELEILIENQQKTETQTDKQNDIENESEKSTCHPENRVGYPILAIQRPH